MNTNWKNFEERMSGTEKTSVGTQIVFFGKPIMVFVKKFVFATPSYKIWKCNSDLNWWKCSQRDTVCETDKLIKILLLFKRRKSQVNQLLSPKSSKSGFYQVRFWSRLALNVNMWLPSEYKLCLRSEFKGKRREKLWNDKYPKFRRPKINEPWLEMIIVD